MQFGRPASIFTVCQMSPIAENLQHVRQRVRSLALANGRDPEDVRIVAVSKTFGEDVIREAFRAGQTEFGENYAHEFRLKTGILSDLAIQWHFVGHLQSNKAKEVAGKTTLLHSLDRESLAREIQKKAEKLDVVVPVLIEVHSTDEATKSGIDPASAVSFAKIIEPFDRIAVKGLMTMGPFTDDAEHARPCFRLLKDLRDRLRQEGPAGMRFDELSMGMSSDFDVAIEEGATIVRIGTAIFGQRTSTAA